LYIGALYFTPTDLTGYLIDPPAGTFTDLVISLTPDGTGGCRASAEVFMILEVHATLGYKTVRADGNARPSYLPQWGAGNTCKNNAIGQAGPNIVLVY
jgi:hypothetical protein